MEYIVGMWAFFGFLAFIKISSLESKFAKLEKKLREGSIEDKELASLDDLKENLRKRIGKKVEFDFYDEEEDMDLLALDLKKGFIRIVDVDEKWVLVHVENKHSQTDKLIRLSSIKSVKEVDN